MTESEIRWLFLAGEPVGVSDAGMVYPPTLREVARLGYLRYMHYVNLLTLTAKEADDRLNDLPDEWLIFHLLPLQPDDFVQLYLEAIKYFFKVSDVQYSKDLNIISLGGDSLIHSGNCLELKSVISMMNYFKSKKEDDENKPNPKDELAASILRAIEEGKQEVERRKGNSESTVEMTDIISATAAKKGVPLSSVFDETVYQLYDQFNRLRAIDNFDIDLRAMFKGAKIGDLKHWSRNLANEEDSK